VKTAETLKLENLQMSFLMLSIYRFKSLIILLQQKFVP